MERILGIDPGSERSGYVLLVNGVPDEHGWVLNMQLLQRLRDGFADGAHLAVETLHPRGELASRDAFETQLWAGRYVEAADQRGTQHTKIDPLDSRLAVTGRSNAKDGEVKQALIDMFGGNAQAIGGVRCPDCNDGKVWHTGPCNECAATGELSGARGPKRCHVCKGRKQVRERITCETCKGTHMLHPPGVLAGFNNHEYSALAAAVYCHMRHA